MKKSELVIMIKEIVTKEVKKQIKEIFINEKVEHAKIDDLDFLELNIPEVKSLYKKPSTKKKHFSSNKTINNILNETAGLSSVEHQDPSNDLLAEMNETIGSGYNKIQSTDEIKQQKRDLAAVQTLRDANVSVDSVPDHIKTALTKDYSAVLKAIDKKKKK